MIWERNQLKNILDILQQHVEVELFHSPVVIVAAKNLESTPQITFKSKRNKAVVCNSADFLPSNEAGRRVGFCMWKCVK